MQKKNKQYDEFQLLKRHRIGFQTMILFGVLIGLNGFIKEYYITWAPPMIEAFLLIFIPVFYFTLMSLVKNAYLRKLDTHVTTIFMLGFVFLFNLASMIQSLMYGTFSLVEDNMLGNSIVYVFLELFFGVLLISAIINRIKDRREA